MGKYVVKVMKTWGTNPYSSSFTKRTEKHSSMFGAKASAQKHLSNMAKGGAGARGGLAFVKEKTGKWNQQKLSASNHKKVVGGGSLTTKGLTKKPQSKFSRSMGAHLGNSRKRAGTGTVKVKSFIRGRKGGMVRVKAFSRKRGRR